MKIRQLCAFKKYLYLLIKTPNMAETNNKTVSVMPMSFLNNTFSIF